MDSDPHRAQQNALVEAWLLAALMLIPTLLGLRQLVQYVVN